MPSVCAHRLSSVCTAIAFLGLSALSGPAAAAVFGFNVQLGSDGVGHFVYDDDDGGPNFGFTTFAIDLSPALGVAYADITLLPAHAYRPGGGSGDNAFMVFTEPLTLPVAGVSFGPISLSVPIEFSFLNMGWPAVFGPYSHTGPLCTLPGIVAGQYGYCTGTESGVGEFITTREDVEQVAVAEPSAAFLFFGGLFLLAGAIRAHGLPGSFAHRG